MLTNIHRIDENIGDWMSSPLRYFSFPAGTAEVDILGGMPDAVLEHDVVVGGGGLLVTGTFARRMALITERTKGALVAWGIGHNLHSYPAAPLCYPDYLRRFTLVGLRDFNQGLPYVPCASCMSALFDHPGEIRHDVAIYRHGKRAWPFPADPAIPLMNNTETRRHFAGSHEQMDACFRRVIGFLSSAAIIVTNSYHGMYWGVLLGRKVIALPFSSKFHAFQFKVPFIFDGDWRSALGRAQTYSGALEECRHLNRAFYAKVLASLW